MDNLMHHSRHGTTIGTWGWHPQIPKEQFGILIFSDVTIEYGKENDILIRIVTQLINSRYQVISILKRLRPLLTPFEVSYTDGKRTF